MSHTARQERERRDVIIVLILTVLCVILFGLGSLISFESGVFNIVGVYPEDTMATVIPTLKANPTAKPSQQPSPTTSAAQDQKKPHSSGSGFGVSFSQLIDAFAAEGFSFEEKPSDLQVREVEGKSANALAALKIIGHGETIESTQMVIHYPRNNPEVLKKNLGYMVKTIKLALPHWKDAVIWFYANVAELAKKQEEPRESSVLFEGLRLHLILKTMPDLLFLTCESAAP